MRTLEAGHGSGGAAAPLPPFPASLNTSSLSLASRYPSLNHEDDADLSFPEFETNPFGHSPSSTSLASASSAVVGGSLNEGTLQPRPPTTRPGTSMSARSRSDVVGDTESGATARGWPSSLSSSTTANAANLPKDPLATTSRSFGKSLLGKRKDTTAMDENAADAGQKVCTQSLVTSPP